MCPLNSFIGTLHFRHVTCTPASHRSPPLHGGVRERRRGALSLPRADARPYAEDSSGGESRSRARSRGHARVGSVRRRARQRGADAARWPRRVRQPCVNVRGGPARRRSCSAPPALASRWLGAQRLRCTLSSARKRARRRRQRRRSGESGYAPNGSRGRARAPKASYCFGAQMRNWPLQCRKPMMYHMPS